MTIPFQNLPPLVQQQIYLPQAVPRAAPMPTQTLKASTTKRPRSPSPPPSVSIYHQGYGYKQPPIANPNYQTSPQSKYEYNIQQHFNRFNYSFISFSF